MHTCANALSTVEAVSLGQIEAALERFSPASLQERWRAMKRYEKKNVNGPNDHLMVLVPMVLEFESGARCVGRSYLQKRETEAAARPLLMDQSPSKTVTLTRCRCQRQAPNLHEAQKFKENMSF